MRRIVQTHVDVIIVDLAVCVGLLVVGILRFLDLRERIFGWIGENLLLDFVQIGSIIEHVQSIKISVRLEQIIAPSSLRDVRNILGTAARAKVCQSDRPGHARRAIVVVSNIQESRRVCFWHYKCARSQFLCKETFFEKKLTIVTRGGAEMRR